MQTIEFLEKTKNDSIILQSITSKCQKFLQSLLQAKSTFNYIKNRSVSNTSLNKYQFGYFPNEQELDFFSEKEKQALFDFGVLYKNHNSYSSSFAHHSLVFPLIDDYGYYVGLIARSINDQFCKEYDISKYKYSVFTKLTFLYGLYYAKEAIQIKKSAILVEGQLDCIACQSNGFHNTIALGGSYFSFYHAFLLKKYGVKKLYLLLDSDDAGVKAANKMVQQFGHLFEIIQLTLPSEYKDVDLYLKNSQDISILTNIV